MATVGGYSADEVDVLTTDFQAVVMQAIQTALDKTAANLPVAMTAATAYGPNDAQIVTQYWEEQVDGVLTPYIAQVYTGSAAAVALGTATAFPHEDLPGVPLLPDDYALTYMKSRANTLYGVSDEMWEDIRNELVDGIQNGSSTAQVADKIKLVSQLSHNEASKIARTEMHSAVESGNHAQMLYMGFTDDEVDKIWEYTHDGRARETHIAAGGQRKPLSVAFEVGGAHLMFPGDPGGAPDEIIHCRCTVLYDFDTPPKTRCGGHVIAAAQQNSGGCIVPMAAADISAFSSNATVGVFNKFMAQGKISPAWGGAKIHKVVQAVRVELKAGTSLEQNLEAVASDRQIVAMVDKHYLAKGATFGQKYDEWLASPAGQKVVGTPFKPQIIGTKTVAPPVSPATIATTPPTLPPIPGVPSATDLEFTGKKFSSASGAEVWRDKQSGDLWLFKPVSASGSYTNKFLLEIEPALARVQSKALLTRPAVYKIDNLNGKQGTLQFMFKSKEAFPNGSFDPMKLSPEDLLVMQREQIFDWMVSNHDTHSGQFIRLEDGALFGIDKGQAFKFFPKDKLDWNYIPVTPLGQDKLTYSAMWKAYVQGKNIGMQDPTAGELGAYIDRLMAIPDAEYRKLLEPYATLRVQQFGGDVKKFLDDAIARKNSLKKDFADFWARAELERAKVVPKIAVTPKPPPAPPPVVTPTPAPISAAVGDVSGDISGFDYFVKSDISQHWYTIGGDKKVTPAWGGAKIWKQLVELKKQEDAAWAHVGMAGQGPNELQLLRILDEFDGHAGKPKTLESVLKDWLKSPAGQKAVVNVPKSLKAVPVVGTQTTIPTVTPLVKPAASELQTAIDAIKTKPSITNLEIVQSLSKYEDGDVVAYGKGGSSIYRVVKKSSTKFDIDAQVSGGQWVTLAKDTSAKSQLGGVQWHVVEPTKTSKILPSKIPGKGPGDGITLSEIKQSQYAWHDGDIVAYKKTTFGSEFQIRSDGRGGFTVWSKGEFDPDFIETPTAGDPLDTFMNMPLGKEEWQLTNDVLLPYKASNVSGLNAGDVMTTDEIMTATVKAGHSIAYAYDSKNKLSYKIGEIGNQKALFYKADDEATWHYFADMGDANHIDLSVKKAQQGMKWHAASADGSMPDIVKVQIPTKSVAGAPQAANAQGFQTGDYISHGEIFNTIYQSPSPGTVIAEGESQIGTKWQIFYDTDDTLHARYFEEPSGKWVDVGTIAAPDEVPTMKNGWAASNKKISPSQPQPIKPVKKVAAKKATPAPAPPPTPAKKPGVYLPGKSAGDVIKGGQDLFGVADQYPDGQLVAVKYYKTYSGQLIEDRRLVKIDGVLIEQKKTKAGNWAGTKVVTHQWDIDWGQWTLKDEMLDAKETKKLTNATIKIKAKASAPPTVTTTKKGYSSTSSYVPPAAKPYVVPHVDTSAWTSSEQIALKDHFKSLNPSGSNAESVFSALANTKAHFEKQFGSGSKYDTMSDLQLLRMIDEQFASAKGVPNNHKYEQLIMDWLQTPSGKAYVSRRIDAPILATEVPIPMEDFAAGPSFDSQKYDVITGAQSLKNRQDSHLKYGGWKSGEKGALRTYTGGSYTSWNAAIRKGNLGSYKNQIIKAQQGMRPSVRPMLLHRGTDWSEFNDPRITSAADLQNFIGRTYINRGFNSASFGGTAGFSGRSVILEIECPIGTPMSHARDYSHVTSENEVTLATHLIYEIKSVRKAAYQTIVRVRVIGVGK